MWERGNFWLAVLVETGKNVSAILPHLLATVSRNLLKKKERKEKHDGFLNENSCRSVAATTVPGDLLLTLSVLLRKLNGSDLLLICRV